MEIENILQKTNRINMLFDFYHRLLTEKQQTFLKLYFHDDYSLAEIAEQFNISRQAVYEHIKRAEHVLQEYEEKLGLLTQHEQRLECVQQMELLLEEVDAMHRKPLQRWLEKLANIGHSSY